MRTCILHIGSPKAGSTTIQGFLGVYRRALAEQGIDVPDFGFGDVVRGPIALSSALAQERDPARPSTEPWRWLDGWLAETEGDVCISREALCERFVRESEFAFVKAFFERRGFRLKLVVYVRDQAEFLNASYTQRAKTLRIVEDFHVWTDRQLAAPPVRFSYWRMLRHALKQDDVVVTAAPLSQVAGAALIPDFCRRLGVPDLDASGFDPTPFRNATPGPLAIAAAIRVARALAALGIDVEKRPTISRDFERVIDQRGWAEHAFWGPDADLAARTRAAYAHDNDRLAHRLWGAPWSDVVPPCERARTRLDALTPEERAAIDEVASAFVAHVTRKPLLGRLLDMARAYRA